MQSYASNGEDCLWCLVDVQLFWSSLFSLFHLSKEIFPSIFYYCYTVVLSFKTHSSIFYHFTNLYSIAIVEVLFLIHYPLEKHFKEGYNFSVFYSRSVFSSNLAGLESQIFYSLSWVIMGAFGVSLTKINRNYKTQSSNQKWW